mgnify:CR=1 FL=1
MATLNEVYANSGYAASSRNLASISYATDNVFSDGYDLEMGTFTGSPTKEIGRASCRERV